MLAYWVNVFKCELKWTYILQHSSQWHVLNVNCKHCDTFNEDFMEECWTMLYAVKNEPIKSYGIVQTAQWFVLIGENL